MAYLVKFYNLAKGKITTYIAVGTAGLNELLNSWDATAALLPPFLIAHKAHLVSLAALSVVWSRIRKELKQT